jgi:thioredoxin-related protein
MAVAKKIQALLFSAPWCGYCPGFKNVVKKHLEKNPDDFELEIIADADTSSRTEEHEVECFPTTVFLDGEHELYRIEGAVGQRAFGNEMAKVKKLLAELRKAKPKPRGRAKAS